MELNRIQQGFQFVCLFVYIFAAALRGFQSGICYHGNGSRNVVGPPLGGHTRSV